MRKITRKLWGRRATDQPADPLLVFIAVTLFAFLLICEAHLHRDELGALGVVISEEGIDPQFVGP